MSVIGVSHVKVCRLCILVSLGSGFMRVSNALFIAVLYGGAVLTARHTAVIAESILGRPCWDFWSMFLAPRAGKGETPAALVAHCARSLSDLSVKPQALLRALLAQSLPHSA